MIFIAISAGKGDLSDRIVRLSKHSLRPFRSGKDNVFLYTDAKHLFVLMLKSGTADPYRICHFIQGSVLPRIAQNISMKHRQRRIAAL